MIVRLSNQDFRHFASELVGDEVEVTTSNGTYTGTLEYVGGDFIILRSRVRGRLIRRAIRIALIIALLSLFTGRSISL